MFPQTSNGQKPVDMFLTAILRTGTKNDYLSPGEEDTIHVKAVESDICADPAQHTGMDDPV